MPYKLILSFVIYVLYKRTVHEIIEMIIVDLYFILWWLLYKIL